MAALDRFRAPLPAIDRTTTLPPLPASPTASPQATLSRSLPRPPSGGEAEAPAASSAPSGVDYDKIIRVLTHQATTDNHERHLHGLRKIARSNPDGFPLRDVGSLTTVLDLVLAKALGADPQEADYCSALEPVVALAAKPFTKERASQERNEEATATTLLSTLGRYLVVPSEDLRLAVLLCLASFQFATGGDPARASSAGARRLLAVNQKAIMRSEVAGPVAQLLAAGSGCSSAVRAAALELLLELTADGANAAPVVAVPAAAPAIATFLDSEEFELSVELQAVELLWNLLESEEHGVAFADQLCTEGSAKHAVEYFGHLCTRADSPHRKGLRNDALTLIVLIARDPNAPEVLHAVGLLDILLPLLTAGRSRLAAEAPEDYELHRLGVNLACRLGQHRVCSEAIAKGRLLETLFEYTLPAPARAWTPPQYEELQLQALSVLGTLLPLYPVDFKRVRGAARLLKCLEWSLQEGVQAVGERAFPGAGNSFYSSGDFSNTMDRARAAAGQSNNGRRGHTVQCLRALIGVCAADHTGAVSQDLIDQELLTQLLVYLDTPMCEPVDAIELRIRADVWFLLAAVCRGAPHSQELFGSWGVRSLMPYLVLDELLLAKNIGHAELITAALDAVWCCVVGCALNESVFLTEEGAFLLLDVMEAGPSDIQGMAFGALLDLCANPKAVTHVEHWRSSKDASRTALHLFLQLWRVETGRIGVSVADGGLLADTAFPLMGRKQRETEIIPRLGSMEPTAAILEVAENMRAKVHAMVAILGPGVEAADLSTEERVSLLAIQEYLTLKRGEAWHDLAREFDASGFEPVEIDSESMRLISSANAAAVARIREGQAELLLRSEEAVLEAERQQYETIKAHRTNEANAALRASQRLQLSGSDGVPGGDVH